MSFQNTFCSDKYLASHTLDARVKCLLLLPDFKITWNLTIEISETPKCRVVRNKSTDWEISRSWWIRVPSVIGKAPKIKRSEREGGVEVSQVNMSWVSALGNCMGSVFPVKLWNSTLGSVWNECLPWETELWLSTVRNCENKKYPIEWEFSKEIIIRIYKIRRYMKVLLGLEDRRNTCKQECM
jgi:hypothetical protein